MVSIQELQNLDPSAWQRLLCQVRGTAVTPIAQVDVEQCGSCSNLVRYLLGLANELDAVPLVGKWTSAREARFYRDLAAGLPDVTPHCWLAHVNREQSWLILGDVSGNFAPAVWTEGDLERMVTVLAAVHTAFWKNGRVLSWLPHLLHGTQQEERLIRELADRFHGAAYYPGPYQAALSEHALRWSGRLAPALAQAGLALRQLDVLGGWPEVIQEQAVTAVTDLLDDPAPMVQMLLDLPICLLHGDPAPRHWQLNWLDDVYLLDWGRTAVGPAIFDLISFLEQLHLSPDQAGRFSEETLIDSYMLRMSARLGKRFPARQMRLALPAARALYILTAQLPKLVSWLQPLTRQPELPANGLTDEWLRQAGAGKLAAQRPQLAAMFHRFWRAYKLL